MKRERPEIPAPMPISGPKTITLQAEPAPLQIDLQRTAIMVIDVQNAFLSEGGFFTLPVPDTSLAETISDPSEKIRNIKRITATARARGIKVIYTLSINPPHQSIGPDSPYWYKNDTVTLEREHPEWRDKLITRGTWGAEIIAELKPEEGDILVEKPRYSAFFQTNLDTILRTYNFKYLIFTGVATNICVEAAIRDAYYREYFCILVPDAAVNSGPEFTQEATIFNVKARYGWISTTENILKAME